MKINRPPPAPGNDAARAALSTGAGKPGGPGAARGPAAPASPGQASTAAGHGARAAAALLPGLDDPDLADPGADGASRPAPRPRSSGAEAGPAVQRRARQRPKSDPDHPAMPQLSAEARELMAALQRQADALPGAERLFAQHQPLGPGQRDESLVDYLLSAARQARSIKAAGNSPVMVQMQGVRAYVNATDSLPDTPPTLASVKSLLVSRQAVQAQVVQAQAVQAQAAAAPTPTAAAPRGRPSPSGRPAGADAQGDMYALLPLMALNAMQVKPQRLAAVRAARIDLVMALGRRVKLAAGE